MTGDLKNLSVLKVPTKNICWRDFSWATCREGRCISETISFFVVPIIKHLSDLYSTFKLEMITSELLYHLPLLFVG